jgi:hypothetical protein
VEVEDKIKNNRKHVKRVGEENQFELEILARRN